MISFMSVKSFPFISATLHTSPSHLTPLSNKVTFTFSQCIHSQYLPSTSYCDGPFLFFIFKLRIGLECKKTQMGGLMEGRKGSKIDYDIDFVTI